MKLTVYSLILVLLSACGVQQTSPRAPTNVIPQWYRYSEVSYSIVSITNSCNAISVLGAQIYAKYNSIDDKTYIYRTLSDCNANIAKPPCTLTVPSTSTNTCYVGGISTLNGKEIAATFIWDETDAVIYLIPWLAM